jgi:enoyl-CoA hydratase/carnithine racemase
MIDLRLTARVYELSMARPPLNEIGTDMLSDLERCLDAIRPEEADAVILHSALPGGFSAGADLRELYRGLADVPPSDHDREMRRFLDRVHAVMDRLDTLPLVTVAAIHGVSFGGGFELALACDLRIADPTARFCFPELRLGIIPCFGGIPRLHRDLGNAVVRDLLLTGRSLNAKRAHEVGLVNQLVAAGEGLAAARRTAEQITKFDAEARATAKRFLKPVPKEALAQEKEIMLRLFRRPALKEALRRFVESGDVRPYLP